MASPAVLPHASTAKRSEKSENVVSLTVGLEARERLGLFFVVRLEPGLRP